MAITNLDIGKTITLIKDTEEITGILKSIVLTPEVIEQLPGEAQGSYSPEWKAGNRVITVDINVTTDNHNSTILTAVEGVTEFEIKGDDYIVQSIGVTGDPTNRKVLMTLIYNQGTKVDDIADITLTLYKDIDGGGIPINPHVFTGLVDADNIELTPLGSPFTYELRFKVYQYSDDDFYMTQNLFNYFFGGFVLTKKYTKGTEQTETWQNDQVAQMEQSPTFKMNDRTGARVVQYVLNVASAKRTLTA